METEKCKYVVFVLGVAVIVLLVLLLGGCTSPKAFCNSAYIEPLPWQCHATFNRGQEIIHVEGE